jgi:phospholipase C
VSTVPTTNEIFPGDAGHPAGPYGLGIRVPMLIVSPWTRGGWVNSQLFDHTSMIKFLETRFGHGRPDLVETNITPWRRAVVGDLTSAFDFKTPNRSRPVRLPDTDDFKPDDLVRFPDQPPVPPADQQVPHQEHGVRPARALPYTLHATAAVGSHSVSIEFRDSGTAAAVFHVRQAGSADGPRSYTVESGKRVTDTWTFDEAYDVSVHGPNGFFRQFRGGGGARLDIKPSYDERGRRIGLELKNRGTHRVDVTIRDRYQSHPTTLSLRPGETEHEHWSLDRTHGWYDLTVTVHGDAGFEYRYAGHVENGEDSISDPALGGLV